MKNVRSLPMNVKDKCYGGKPVGKVSVASAVYTASSGVFEIKDLVIDNANSVYYVFFD